MHRIAIQLSPDLVDNICQTMNIENNGALDNSSYAVVSVVTSSKFIFELMSEDEIFEAAKNDPDLLIHSV